MSQIDTLLFEMARRVILFKSSTTLPDLTILGYNGNPNDAIEINSSGEFLLVKSPTGTRYQEDNGIQWYKKELPNVWEKFGGSSDVKLIDERAVPETIGGIIKDRTFSAPGVELIEVVRDLLYPYQYPGFSTFTESTIFKTHEVGTLIDTAKIASYSISNFENIKVASDVVSSSSNPKISFPSEEAETSEQVTITVDDLLLTDVGSETCTITGINSEDENFSKTLTLNARKYFYDFKGFVGIAPSNSNDIRLLDKTFLSSSNTGVFNRNIIAGTQEFAFYIPSTKSYEVIDTGNLNATLTNSFIESLVNIEHGNGIITEYKKCVIYLGMSGYPSDTNFKITIS